jgi:hypothetical protein
MVRLGRKEGRAGRKTLAFLCDCIEWLFRPHCIKLPHWAGEGWQADGMRLCQVSKGA